MKKFFKYATAAVFLACLLTACSQDSQSQEDDMPPQIPVALEEMKIDTIESTNVAIGEIVAQNQVDLFVNGSGYIEKVPVKTGDEIQKGDLVMQLDDNEAGNASYISTESRLRTLRDDLGDQLDSARDNLETQKVLFDEDVISKAEFEKVELHVSSL